MGKTPQDLTAPHFPSMKEFLAAEKDPTSALNEWLRHNTTVYIADKKYNIESQRGLGSTLVESLTEKWRSFWSKKTDTPASAPTSSTLPAAAMAPAETVSTPRGLVNPGSCCFMNSVLQAQALSWERAGVLNDLRQGLTVSPLCALLECMLPMGTPQADITHIATQLLNDEMPILADDLYLRIQEAIQCYQSMRVAFLTLCHRLNKADIATGSTIEAQTQFLQCYKRYGEMIGLNSVSEILNCTAGQPLDLARIAQQDAQEFLYTLQIMFGVHRRLSCTVQQATRLKLYEPKPVSASYPRGLRYLDTRLIRDPQHTATVSVPITGETLQGCLDNLGKEEMIPPGEAPSWPEERRQEHNIPHGIPTATSRAQRLLCQEPPEMLSLHMSLFSHTDRQGQPLPQMRYLRHEGRNLLQTLPRTVYMSLTQAQTESSFQVPYTVRSIVCHRGHSLSSGHYLTLRFEGDKIWVCNDTRVLEFHDYLAHKGLSPQMTLEEFCAHQKLAVYVINIERTRSEQPSTSTAPQPRPDQR